MHKLTANIAFMFPDRPFLDRIDAAKAAGFQYVECHFPYEFPIPVLKERLAKASISLTGLNTAPGDQKAGEWVMRQFRAASRSEEHTSELQSHA